MKARVTCASAVVAMVSLGSLSAQITWTQKAPAVSPPVRYGHAMVYDSQRGVVVLFGGAVPDGHLFLPMAWRNDTWEWDGTTWTQRISATSPPAQVYPAMAYDSARGRTVLLGSAIGETWEWDGSDWQVVMAPTGPTSFTTVIPDRCMTFDSARGRVVLFGGTSGGNSPTVQTWEWDGVNWQDRTQTLGPPGSVSVVPQWSAAFDSDRGRIVLTGAQTWEWNGVSWEWLSGSGHGGFVSPIVYDAAVGRCMSSLGGAQGAESWLWNGTYWIEAPASAGPPSRIFYALAYDTARGVTVTFGGATAGFQGTADTWERSATFASSRTATFGSGCGSPELAFAPVPTAPPAIGHTTVSTVTNAYLGIAFVAWGTSNTTWGSATLPIALDQFGFEGCSLLQTGDMVLDSPCTSTSWTTAQQSVAIPNDQALVGLSLYEQAWTFQPGFNSLGIVLSNGLAITIGDI